MITATTLLPRQVLFELLPAAFEPWGSIGAYTSRPPNDVSVRRIEAELNVTLPVLLLDVARACPSYGGWFASVGDDFESHNHILNINRAFRESGVPPQYVLLNHGHDGDCDVWDRQAAPVAGELAILSFRFDEDRGEIGNLRVAAGSFAIYLDAFVRERAPRCPVKNLRRHAKRLLAEQQAAT